MHVGRVTPGFIYIPDAETEAQSSLMDESFLYVGSKIVNNLYWL